MSQDFLDINELNNVEVPKEREIPEQEELQTNSLSPLIGYGLYRVSEMPEVKTAVNEKINECKESFKDSYETAKEWASEKYENLKDAISEKYEDAKEVISEFGNKLINGIKDFCCGVYENITEFFGAKEKPNPTAYQFPESAKLSEGITEGREFGLDKCTEAALEIFNPGVISEWGNMTEEERKAIALSYADEVAKAFELVNYRGVYIEELEYGILGSNNGDGTIHLSTELISPYSTPFQIMDTITHELRHQYQSECIRGYHDVTDEVRNEWAVATAIYNYDQPSCYDPWGYSYNPLEIDSNYAGNTVVRNVSSQMFNDIINA